MEKERIDQLAEIFKALAHPTRLQIVAGLLKKDECNVSKMTESLKIPQPTISQHISILKNCGIIEGYRKGNQICYRITNEQVRAIINSIK
ncbi:MAG: hypothetical protein ACD_20C00279G0003 [uncultured bacterium]|nr:MAG: hypothetical protein ACD_20C00279G0003 [uncultured bacterium]